MRTNDIMLNAQKNKMDEFYTKYETISNELEHYRNFLYFRFLVQVKQEVAFV